MKKITYSLFLLLLLQSCLDNSPNKDLFGHWISTKSSNVVELTFFNDLIIYNSWGKTTKYRWEKDGTKIYYVPLTTGNIESEHFIMEYHLNAQKDTLFFRNSDSGLINEFIRKRE